MSVHRAKSNSKNGRAAAPRAVAFYDLDGTLGGLNLSHATLYILTNLGEWSGRLGYAMGLLARAPRLYFAERQDRRILNTALFEIFKGVSRDRLVTLGEEYCERVLTRNLFPRAIEL